MTATRYQWYVGRLPSGALDAFRWEVNLGTPQAIPGYTHTIGPFRTKRAAIWAEKYGRDNPHFRHVDDAERIAKQQA